MVFSSATFLILFLPVTLLLYYGVGVKLTGNVTVKNLILLTASLVFYAWGEPVYIILMLLSIVFNYAAGLRIDALKNSGDAHGAKRAFIFALVFDLFSLAFFKYFGFFAQNIGAMLHTDLHVPQILLPVGISFYTFQIMSYVIDLYRGEVKAQKDLLGFALYVTLFPQLIAGPIVKYRDVDTQLHFRKEDLNKFSRGMCRFIVGLAKKLLLANTLGAAYASVQAMGAKQTGALAAWTGIVCYSLQIYFDFSGYSDMAIGLGGMFGFHFNENFNYPYIADSITEFWRRWHISLSTWFREYVYIPLGGNRRGTARTIFDLSVVWFLTGMWHGAAWNFIFWGVYYGVLLIIEKYVLAGKLQKIPSPLRHVLTLIVVAVGWVFFSAPTLGEAFTYLGAMLGLCAGPIGEGSLFLLVQNIAVIAIGAFCCTPAYRKVVEKLPDELVNKCRIAAYPLLLIVCVMFMISDSYNPFLYFRF